MALSPSLERSQSRWQRLADCATNPLMFFDQLSMIARDAALAMQSRADLQAIVDEINPVLYVANQPHATTETGAEPPRMSWPILDADSHVACTLIADLQLMSSGSEHRIKKLSVLGSAMPLVQASERATDPRVLAQVSNYQASQATLQEIGDTIGQEDFLSAVQYTHRQLGHPVVDRTKSQVQVIPLVLGDQAVSLCIDAVGHGAARDIFDVSVREGVLPAHGRVIQVIRERKSRDAVAAALVTDQAETPPLYDPELAAQVLAAMDLAPAEMLHLPTERAPVVDASHDVPARVESSERQAIRDAAFRLGYRTIFPLLTAMYLPAQLHNTFHQEQLRAGFATSEGIRARLSGLPIGTPLTADYLDQAELANAGVHDLGMTDGAGNPFLAVYLNLDRAEALFEPLVAMPSDQPIVTEGQCAAWFALADVMARYTFVDFHRRSPYHKEGVSPDAQWFMEMIIAIDKYMLWCTSQMDGSDTTKAMVLNKFILPGTNIDLQAACSEDQVRGHAVAKQVIAAIDRAVGQDLQNLLDRLATLRHTPIVSAARYIQAPDFQVLLDA
ncbi:hypothetical protein KA517_01720 [Candidatus Gracilibacteria bacterium]|nr:hypothetical protein [Candidatus Gracilibacteria bacterium]